MARTARRKPKTTKDQAGRFQDILEATRLLGSSTVPEKVVETVLASLCERLGKRARCAYLEGDDLTLRFWAGERIVPVAGLKVHRNSIVWEVVRKGVAVNLTDPHQTNGYAHTLSEPVRIKAIIPLGYSDPITRQEKRLGALIVDSGQNGLPISAEDFEYLQVIGELISAIIGRAELIDQLMTSCRRQEAILMETAHNFRNRIAVIGGFSRRIAHLAQGTELADRATHLGEEVEALQAHLAQFERYMSLKP